MKEMSIDGWKVTVSVGKQEVRSTDLVIVIPFGKRGNADICIEELVKAGILKEVA